MKIHVLTLAIIGLFVVAGCGGGGGGGSLSALEEEQLQQELEAAEAEKAEAERQAAEAERKRQEEEEARKKAEAEAEGQRQAAEQAAQAEQEAELAQQQAEAERQRLAEQAAEAEQALNRQQAQRALAQLSQSLTSFPGSVVTRHRGQATVTGMPRRFASSSGSNDGGWYVTRLATDNNSRKEVIVIYSDVEAPTQQLLSEEYANEFSPYSADDSQLVATIDNARDSQRIASSRFPTRAVTSDPFTPTIDSDPTSDDQGSTSDEDDVPSNDYDIVRLAGTYAGASGHFYCTGADCTVTHSGGGVYAMQGGSGWTFRASKTARVSADDEAHTYFGWWMNHDLATDALTFSSFTGGLGSTPTAAFATLNGSYTYRGRATGQYALYSRIAPDSGSGEFTANATLQASFDGDGTGTISGRITGISGHPNWALTLNETATSTDGSFENATNGVDWTIDGYTQTGGSYDGQFYFDAEEGGVPTAAVGEFIGHYGTEGRIIGAFGAHQQ